MAKDRAIPFSISLPLSKLEKLETVLKVAVHQGKLTGDPNRPNKLAAEALILLAAEWEAEFRAKGLLPHAAPIAPGLLPPSQPVDASRLAVDPTARAAARRAGGFGGGAPGDDEPVGGQILPEPPGINWDE